MIQRKEESPRPHGPGSGASDAERERSELRSKHFRHSSLRSRSAPLSGLCGPGLSSLLIHNVPPSPPLES